MPSGSNASRSKSSNGPVPRSVKQVIHGDAEIAGAGGNKNMKRAKRVRAEMSSVVASNLEDPQSKKRFVGVRQRPSGRWVAEIKDTTQKIRLWLGTFDSAEEGAKAYDSAARALRGANTRTNFVPAIASCEGGTVPSKAAARLIRLRQTSAAPNSKPYSAKRETAETKLGHSQEGILIAQAHHVAPQQQFSSSAITSEKLSKAINHSLTTAAESPQESSSQISTGLISPLENSINGASTAASSTADGGNKQLHEQEQESLPFPCATNRADVSLCTAAAAASDKEAASSADDNEVMFTTTSTCQDDAESPLIQCPASSEPPAAALSKEGMENKGLNSSDLYHMDDQLDHRNSPILREKESYCFPEGGVVLDMIPWLDYVLMDGLADLSCEMSTTGVTYPAFDFSAEAMDRDSLEDQHYLSDDSSEFLLGMQQHSSSTTTHSSFQGQCELIPKSASSSTDHELPRPLVSPPEPWDGDHQSPGSMDTVDSECQGQEQALWGSMDPAPLCMVA